MGYENLIGILNDSQPLQVMEESQRTINCNVSDGVITYEEKARDLWLFDHAAQVALAGNQIWWSTEVRANGYLSLIISSYT